MGRNLEKRINQEIKVDIIASSYEWTCPTCKKLNHEIEWKSEVTCRNCGGFFGTNDPEHALGN